MIVRLVCIKFIIFLQILKVFNFSDSTGEFQFKITADFYKRSFMGNRSGGKELSDVKICGNSQAEILEKIWEHAKKYIKREIIVTTGENDQLEVS
jgi:hypothetical protein